MREVKKTSKFKTSFKRVKKNIKFNQEAFEFIVLMLASDIDLPDRFKDHQLIGQFKNFRECHLSPDILLIYTKDIDVITLQLVDIGSHSSLF